MTPPRELIDAYLDGEASANQQEQLRSWLLADPANVRAFVEEVQLNQLLRAEFLAQATHAAAAVDRSADGLVRANSLAKPSGPTVETGLRFGECTRPGNGRFLPAPAALADEAVRALIAWIRLRQPLRIPALAASIVLALGLSLWLFPSTQNEPTLSIALGTQVALERAGQSLPASDGLSLLPGDMLRISGSNGAALTYGQENTRVVLDDQAELRVLAWSQGKRLELRQGKVQAIAARQRLWDPMILVTAQAEARVLGTRFSLSATTNATRLDVTEGRVRFTRRSDAAAVKVGAGNYAVAMANSELAALPFTGRVRREWWSGVSGKVVEDLRADPRYPSQPDGSELDDAFELKPVSTNSVGVRFCGYVHPPVTGDYEFWLTGGPRSVLLMSPSEDPAESVTVAGIFYPNRDFEQPRGTGASPWAPPVLLVAGRRYYIEALILIEEGEGHLSVFWKIPGRPREPLTGEYLSPFKPK